MDATSLATLPNQWHRDVARVLEPKERLIAFLELDLDSQNRYAPGLLVLTARRLLAFAPDAQAKGGTGEFQQWTLNPGMVLRSSTYAGLGKIELLETGDASESLGAWRYTAAKSALGDRFANVVTGAVRSRAARASGEAEVTRCASCGAVLTADQPICMTCAPSAAPSPSRSLIRLNRFAMRRIRIIVTGMILTLMATAAGLIPPYLTMPLLDKVLIPWQGGAPINYSLVQLYLGGLAAAAVLAWILGWAKTYVLALASEQVSGDLRDATYAHLQRLSLEFYGGRRTGDLISRISSDTDRICNFLSVHLVDFVSDVLMFVLTSIVLISIDPVLAVATLLPFPFIAWLVQDVRTRLRHGFARASNAWSDMVSVLADAIPGVRVVKAFAQESREIERFKDANTSVLDANIRVNRLWAFFGPTVTLLTEFGVLVIWGFGVWRVSTGNITVGVLTAFLAYISRFYIRLDSMSRMIANTQRAAASTYRVFEILDRQPSVMEPVKPMLPGRLKGSLELRDVQFRYGSREVLKGVSLSIRPGELIGLVGASGSGKSTLVNLVCRFYDVTQGAILADDVDIRSYPVEQYRQNIGIVLQEPFLFYGTIAENIAYGRPNAPREEIIRAARAAHAHGFIMRLPDGYDSLVGERGQSLSGGERQRISIARALLTDPRILILDEATSAVDNETEREIQAALDNLIRGRTTIAIAHRLSTLRHADRIVVLEQGRVVEIGPHEKLLEQRGVYSRLYHAQLESHGQLAL